MTGFLHALALDGLRLPDGTPDAGPGTTGTSGIAGLVRIAAAAEAAGVDILSLGDPLAAPPTPGTPAGIGLSAAETLAFLARKTRTIQLLPAASSHYSEPFHAAKATATLDFVSGGRAGVLVDYGQSPEADAHYPSLAPAPLEIRAEQAGEFTEVIRKLWDSWEDGAEIRDRASGRYVDAAKVHSINHRGSHFTVRGPLITPWPPQGQPVVAVRVDPGLLGQGAGSGWSELLALAASQADLVLLSGPGPLDPARAGAAATELRQAAGDQRIQVLARLPIRVDSLDNSAQINVSATANGSVNASEAAETAARLHAAGLDGVEYALEGSWDAAAAEALLQTIPRTADGAATSFRTRLGLARPASRYAAVNN